MTKLIVLAFALIGFYAASIAYFPSVWNPFTWHIPYSNLFLSWGIVGMAGLAYVGFRLKAK